MCQINKDNRDCNFQQHFRRWENGEKFEDIPSEVAKSHLILPISTDEYCLFHSHDIGWKKENSFDKYLINFFILSEWDKEVTSVDVVDAVIVAPIDKADIIFNGAVFKKKVRIANSRFVDNVHFKNSTFENDVDFFKVKFEGEVYFNESQSFKAFFFVRCYFLKKAYFNAASFYGETGRDYSSFNFSTFDAQANFSGCKFLGKNSDANFQLITFKDIAYFTGSLFEKRCLFNGTKFEKRADFDGVIFQQDVFFTPRPEEGKIFNPTFTEANFSKAQFHGKAAFDDAYMGKAVFSEALVFSILQFINATFQDSAFDDLFLKENGRIHFIGNQNNLVFTDTIAFHLISERLQGYLYFKQVKVAYITAPSLKTLEELRESGKVFFSDDCEFAVNSNYVSYKVSGAEGNYDLFNIIFEGLKTWVYIFFRNPKRISLDVIKADPAANIILIKVTWGQQQDFDLYVNLALYYFQSLPYQESNNGAFLKKLSDPDFLKSLLIPNESLQRKIKAELEDHIAEVSLRIKNILRRASLIEFEIQSKQKSIFNAIPELNFSENQINLEALNEDIKEVVSATLVSSVKQLSDKSAVEQQYKIVTNLNFNKLSIFMDNSKNYATGDIKFESGILQIGEGNVASNAVTENDLDFNKLVEELPQLIGALKTNQDIHLKKEELDAIIAAYEASKRKDKKSVMEKLGAVGKWVADIAAKLGVEYVKNLLPK
ncbi:MAG TPA: pentapeptide repeat-containing protein [Panacibacter sp.]|nr:pentapeptide repeat-containing protein [Panacibacter sp.]